MANPAAFAEAGITPATDDWPFLYLPGRKWHELPKPYFVLIGLLALISVVWILAGSGRVTGISPHFFFLGAAFLLIEVKGITELALVFGTTWIVSSVVIAAILIDMGHESQHVRIARITCQGTRPIVERLLV